MLDFLACDTVNINMTSLQGKITTTYDKLVEVFGEPTMTDASPYEKVNAQWSMEFKVPFTDETGIEDFETVPLLFIIGTMDTSLLRCMTGTLVVSIMKLLIVFRKYLTLRRLSGRIT